MYGFSRPELLACAKRSRPVNLQPFHWLFHVRTPSCVHGQFTVPRGARRDRLSSLCTESCSWLSAKTPNRFLDPFPLSIEELGLAYRRNQYTWAHHCAMRTRPRVRSMELAFEGTQDYTRSEIARPPLFLPPFAKVAFIVRMGAAAGRTDKFPRTCPQILAQIDPRIGWDGIAPDNYLVATLLVLALDPKFSCCRHGSNLGG